MADASRAGRLSDVVDALCRVNAGVARAASRHPCAQPLPARAAVLESVEQLRAALFPGYFGESELDGESMRYYIGSTLDRAARTLVEQVRRGLCFHCEDTISESECEARAQGIVDALLARLPALERLATSDVQAAYEGDPALHSPDEAIFCYPGLFAITSQRIAHELFKLGVPLLPRMITEHAHSITGIDIHPGAEIGEKFFIDHGTGVVIGETTVIGNRVRLYQGVTLGAKSFPLDEHGKPIKGIARHPIVEDDVIVYSGATILGRITIGRGSIVGGNVWLTRSVPPESHVAQPQARPEIHNSGSGI
jgi:serine O-acetyltransferase